MARLLPLFLGAALFLLLVVTFRFTPLGFVLALLGGALGYLGLGRWQGRLLARGPSPQALERLAMKEAWRRGGLLRPQDLAPFLPEAEARALLEGLAQRGFCRREGEGFRF
ncbi:uncharacterized protein TTMY_2331 [Thermus thermophilus]|uniref:hypothetical protein n=1 Tax=Thermus thermophilus TaxID=274 RepID=UPI00090CA75A|nr:hypothetical protein [Thermus thermophilus]BAW02694.1 uncharacterized protein TTMY_2331 [Thermus thermophilus]BDB10915.1 hypothetical protein TthTMY_06540 [Thermus thermophilus]